MLFPNGSHSSSEINSLLLLLLLLLLFFLCFFFSSFSLFFGVFRFRFSLTSLLGSAFGSCCSLVTRFLGFSRSSFNRLFSFLNRLSDCLLKGIFLSLILLLLTGFLNFFLGVFDGFLQSIVFRLTINSLFSLTSCLFSGFDHLISFVLGLILISDLLFFILNFFDSSDSLLGRLFLILLLLKFFNRVLD